MQVTHTRVQLSHSKHVVYRLQATQHDKSPDTQAAAMAANKSAMQPLSDPGVLELRGWHITAELLEALPALQPSCAVVFGTDVVWPAAGTAAAAQLCRKLGQKLACAPHIHWVVHDSCGVYNLTHMLLGIGDKEGVVQVITQDAGFIPAVMEAVGMHMEPGQELQTVATAFGSFAELMRPPDS